MNAPALPPPMQVRLVPSDLGAPPAGLHLTRQSAGVLLERIAPRIARYAGLRLAMAGGDVVIFASEPAPLPWSEAPLGFLATDGPLFVPCGLRLNVPAPWRAEVIRRLLADHGFAGPALLTPIPSGLHLLDLAGSRPLTEVDIDRLRGRA